MSGALDDVYSAIEESARRLGVPCARDRVWPILTAYGDALPDGAIILSVSTGTRECDYTVQVPPGIDDPYAHALAHGFVAATDHPAGALLGEVAARVAVDEFFFDCGVAGGFQKLYASFRTDQRAAADLAGLPSMPPAAGAGADLFARYDLTDVSVVGVDYRRATMNLYFQVPAATAGHLDPAAVRSILRDTGLPEPDERMLRLACAAYRVYVTLDWESPRVRRLAFAPRPGPGVDLAAVADLLAPEVRDFMTGARPAYGGERIGILVPKWTPGGAHLNLGFYYQVSPQAKPLMARQAPG